MTDNSEIAAIVAESVTWMRGLMALDPGPTDPAALRRACIDRFADIEARARRAGLGADQTKDLQYPFAALADELIMNSDVTLGAVWKLETLQFRLFNESNAGDTFFTRLGRLMDDKYGPPELLRAYYVCLALGFAGQHAVTGGEVELRRVTRRVHEQLRQRGLASQDGLAALYTGCAETVQPATGTLPWTALSATAAVVFCWAVWAALSGRAERLADGTRGQLPKAVDWTMHEKGGR